MWKFLAGLMLGMIYCLIMKEKDRVQIINGNSINKIEEKVKNINAGGCGYFALHLYERTNKKGYSIISIGGLNHVVLRDNVDSFYIDATGVHTKLWFQLNYGNKPFNEISEDSLKHLLSNWNNWNKKFDRKDTAYIKYYIDNL